MQTQQIATSAIVPTIHAATSAPVISIRYATITQAAKLRPAFTAAALRDIRFKAADRINSRSEIIKGNGSAAAWVTIGRKVLLDLDAFDAWIDSHRGQ